MKSLILKNLGFKESPGFTTGWWYAVEALRKKERQDETQFITKIDGFLSFISC
jgi:hypothetical protein